ncbi:unnamed protein product [marine sediment metagenome]|uniref:Uncharacterized protein n=1 Tax=marine sediment metagenome TaxID=412755 RepID=X1E3E5_9ZZZZ
MPIIESGPCPRCGGNGIYEEETCDLCLGTGEVDLNDHQGVEYNVGYIVTKVDDIMDKVNDIKEKCDDIFEKLNE